MKKIIAYYQIVGLAFSIILLTNLLIKSGFDSIVWLLFVFTLFTLYASIRYLKKGISDLFIVAQVFQMFTLLISNVKFMFNPCLFLGFGIERVNNQTFLGFEAHLPEFSGVIYLDDQDHGFSVSINLLAILLIYLTYKDIKGPKTS